MNSHHRLSQCTVAALLIAALLGCTEDSDVSDAAVSPAETGPGMLHGQVTRVIDGDTFRVDTLDTSIRVWGLDASETNEAGGSEATATLQQLIAGRDLSCRERDIDRYGRFVGQCFLPDGRDIAAVMIERGVATEYCRYSGGHYGTC
jgi:micrococcal nuclease